MKKSIFILVFLSIYIVKAQEIKPNGDKINGSYTALVAERGASGPTKDKVIQLAENNGVQMLAVAACNKCFPAIYTYCFDPYKTRVLF